MKVRIERPSSGELRYWKVLVDEVIYALCPSQFTAEKTARAFAIYIEHLELYNKVSQ